MFQLYLVPLQANAIQWNFTSEWIYLFNSHSPDIGLMDSQTENMRKEGQRRMKFADDGTAALEKSGTKLSRADTE